MLLWICGFPNNKYDLCLNVNNWSSKLNFTSTIIEKSLILIDLWIKENINVYEYVLENCISALFY